MRIKFSSFCGLSRNPDWQSWLQGIADDLHYDLMQTIRSSKGCRANSKKMYDIYHALYSKNKGKEFESFMRRRFPYMVLEGEKSPQPAPKILAKRKPDPKLIQHRGHEAATDRSAREHYEKLNKHKIFKSYRPDLMVFPQKMILVDKPENLYNQVHRFIKNKLAADYIIIEDRAYIEYFEPRFASVVDKIPREKREIWVYRQKARQADA